MKTLHPIHRMDSLTRVYIPKEIRKKLKWNRDTPLLLFFDETGVFIRECVKECRHCQEIEKLEVHMKACYGCAKHVHISVTPDKLPYID